MVMPRTQSLITFPVEISSPGTTEALQETHWLGFACQLLETKLLQLMRFKFGEVGGAFVIEDEAILRYGGSQC